jgi:hydrogenase-4 component B
MFEFLLGVFLFFVGGVAAIFFKEDMKGKIFLGFAGVSQLFILPVVVGVLLNGRQLEMPFYFSEPIGIAILRLDPLASLFALIISVGALLASIYSIGYMKMYRSGLSAYYFFLGLMSASMLLVVVVQNAILFLIVWEIMSISSFFLVSFENQKEDVRKAGIYYFIAMQIGAAFLIAAFGWTSAASGSLDFNSFSTVLGTSGNISILLFVLFFLGFGTKAGFVPMHTWLPRAHPAAPTGVSALMSGVMIKTGIYGIARIILLSKNLDPRLAYGILLVSLATGIYGVMNAIAQHDIKKLLAYHSIENIGIIGIGLGVGMLGLVYNNPLIAALGFLGGLLHVVNHFTFKSVLFYGSGVVYSQTHTRNIDELGGLGKYLPLTSIMFLIASLAITGLPFFNGFISEFAVYLGLAKSFSMNTLSMNIAALLGFFGLAFIGAMALLCFTKVYGICFLGSPRTNYPSVPNERDWTLLIPMGILVVFMLTIGLFPVLPVILLRNVVTQFLPVEQSYQFDAVIPIFQAISISLVSFAGLFALFFGLRTLLLRKRRVEIFKTWDCGYQIGSPRLQYSGSSFAQPFLRLVEEFVPQKIKVEKEPVLFPQSALLESHAQDLSERMIFRPIIKLLNKFLNLFSWIQSGRMQQYIIYGLIFLIFLLIWIFGVR